MAKKKFTQNDNSYAVCYYRYSSHSQNEASIEQQQEAAHGYAAAHGLTIIKEYEDRARSGTDADRPGYLDMLYEVPKLRPSTLILWKADRLGRDRFDLAIARRTLRDAGCVVRYVAEAIPDDDSPEAMLMEAVLDAMADYYSRQLARNIARGVTHNARHALSNGHRIYGYATDPVTKQYVVDPDTAPIVQRIFREYADGDRLQVIADRLNAEGYKTGRGGKFNVNGLRRILKNDKYTGVYRWDDTVVEGGMPVLVDQATFDKAQAKFAENKRKGPQIAHGMDEDGMPRYWLTGKLFCGECGHSMQSTHGTSKTGARHYYYGCGDHLKRRGCKKKNVRKDEIENIVLRLLSGILNNDTEALAYFAEEAAAYHERAHADTGYLDGLRAKLRETDKGLLNIVTALEKRPDSDALYTRLDELEHAKKTLVDMIAAEEMRAVLMEDKQSIGAYFQKYANANLDDPVVRDQVLNYFVDRIYLYDDGGRKKIVVTGWLAEHGGGRYEEEWKLGDWDLEFDNFAQGSTNGNPAGSETVLRVFISCSPRGIEPREGQTRQWRVCREQSERVIARSAMSIPLCSTNHSEGF